MADLKPFNPLVTPMLTDMYEITMAFAMWRNKRHELPAVFDLLFRKNPFNGEFTIFCGLEEVLKFIASFRFTVEQVAFIKSVHHEMSEGFLHWLLGLDCRDVRVYAMKEGTVCFPNVPVLRVEGPIGVCQLLETTLLCLVNFASLVATNAARHRLVVGDKKKLVEFGLRRAQGPDGAISATRYSYIGGFDGTSNVLASQMFGIDAKGTHAHSWVASFTGFTTLENSKLEGTDGKMYDFLKVVLDFQQELGYVKSSKTELLAFAAYALAFPSTFVALVDTYDTLNSGVPNFLCVALALDTLGYKAVGLRLDSGDLASLSKEVRKMFVSVADEFKRLYFKEFVIFASNDLSEDVILSLNKHGHEIDVFAVGTNLVTCQKQPALGCVYKLVETNGVPCIKLSNDISKVTIPGRKTAHRLYSQKGKFRVDIMSFVGPTDAIDDEKTKQKIIQEGKIFCQAPFDKKKKVYMIPAKIEPLYQLVWQGKLCIELPNIREIRDYCRSQMENVSEDQTRILNPTPYEVSVTKELYDLLHDLWEKNVSIPEIF